MAPTRARTALIDPTAAPTATSLKPSGTSTCPPRVNSYPAGYQYLDGFTTSTVCSLTAIPGDPPDLDNTRTVVCPTCPHGRVFNDASGGRSHFDNSFHEGFALNSLTVLRGTRLSTQTASVPAGAGCTETVGDRRLKVDSFDGSVSRWACLTSVAPDVIRFHLDAAPGTFPVHKDRNARVRLFDGAQTDLNLQGATYGRGRLGR